MARLSSSPRVDFVPALQGAVQVRGVDADQHVAEDRLAGHDVAALFATAAEALARFRPETLRPNRRSPCSRACRRGRPRRRCPAPWTSDGAVLGRGIGPVGWHTFRRTYSTLLHALGTAPVVQKELLRHADIRTALDIYTRAVSGEKRKAASKVAQIDIKFFEFNGGPGEDRTPDPMVAKQKPEILPTFAAACGSHPTVAVSLIVSIF